MSKVDIWMPIYIGDYLGDTQELNAQEHGTYILLLMHYWVKKGEIGSDIDRLARVCRSDVETARLILGSYFTLENGNYRNKRADIEMENAESRRQSATENGKKGGRPPKNNPQKTHGIPGGKPDDNRAGNPQESSSSSSSSSSLSSSSHAPLEKEKDTPLTFESICKQISQEWNTRKLGPQFRFTTSLGLNAKEREGFSICVGRYSPDEIIRAFNNFGAIIANTEEYDAFPKDYRLPGFLASGVEQYLDDARPFDRCKKKQAGLHVTRTAMLDIPEAQL